MQKIKRKTLLYKSGVEYADYGLNVAEGCSHGCTYPCYAMMLKKRCGIVNTYAEWIKPKIIENALELLEKEIPKHKKNIKFVYMCFATDPFMYKQKEISDLSLKVIERLNRDNIRVVTISKGIYPKELVNKDVYGLENEYGSTIVSLSESFRKKHEPFAAPINERIKSLKMLHDNGLRTWVSMEPYPTPNFVEQNIKEILNEISFVDKIIFGKWNYNGMTSYFKEYKNFYNNSAYEVIKFCEQNGIECHIKEKTISKAHVESSCDSRECENLLLQYGAI